MDSQKSMSLSRRFGVEIEINAFDKRNRPFNHELGTLPAGIHEVAELVKSAAEESVTIHKWSNDHHNDVWIVKPDASCGMEICSSVSKGFYGLKKISKVIESLKSDERIFTDDRCSLHVHIDVQDLSVEQVATILTWWIKCEPVFSDAMPDIRKMNQYCQMLGITDVLDSVEKMLEPENLIKKMGRYKYYTCNSYHYHNRRRKTIEFRMMDHSCCKDSNKAKNWIVLLLHFVECAISYGNPKKFAKNNPWTSYCWLDPIDVFMFLSFLPESNISFELQEARLWFIEKLNEEKNIKSNINGVMGHKARLASHLQIDTLYKEIKKQKI